MAWCLIPATQIRPELELAGFTPRLYHLREKNGRHEIDLIAELSGGDIVAIEIKSSAVPTRGDAGSSSAPLHQVVEFQQTD